MNIEQDLAACPFCGSKNHLEFTPLQGELMVEYYPAIRCKKCRIWMDGSHSESSFKKYKNPEEAIKKYNEDIVKRWNKRGGK